MNSDYAYIKSNIFKEYIYVSDDKHDQWRRNVYARNNRDDRDHRQALWSIEACNTPESNRRKRSVSYHFTNNNQSVQEIQISNDTRKSVSQNGKSLPYH